MCGSGINSKMRRLLILIFFCVGTIFGGLTTPKFTTNGLSHGTRLRTNSLEQILDNKSLSLPLSQRQGFQPFKTPLKSDVSSNNKSFNLVKFSSYMFLWYFFTVVYNISNKNALNSFPLPAVVSCLQLLIGLPLFLPIWFFKMPSLDLTTLKSFISFSVFHALGLLTSVMALEAGSVSFTQIVRAAEPVFAALFSTIFLKQVFSTPILLSLIPIIGGVGIASMTDFTFTQRSFILAMLSNIFYQLRIVLTKRFMVNSAVKNSSSSSNITPSQLFQILTLLSLIQLIPAAFFLEYKKIFPAWTALRLSIPPLSFTSTWTQLPFFDQLPLFSNEAAKLFFVNILVSGISFFFHNEVSFLHLSSLIITLDWIPIIGYDESS